MIYSMDLIVRNDSTTQCHGPKRRPYGKFVCRWDRNLPPIQGRIEDIPNNVSKCQNANGISIIHHWGIDHSPWFHYSSLNYKSSGHLCIRNVKWYDKT